MRGRIEQWRLTRTRQGHMPEELWEAAVWAARRYGVSHVARALGVGHAALKARTLAAPPRGSKARAVEKSDGFIEVSGAQLLAPVPVSSLVIEYVAREGSRLTLTVPASCQGFDLPALRHTTKRSASTELLRASASGAAPGSALPLLHRPVQLAPPRARRLRKAFQPCPPAP